MFDKILVPLDGSLLAEQALGTASAIARASDAAVDLVFVHQTVTVGLIRAPWDGDLWEEEHKYLEKIADELESGAGVGTSHAMLTGDAADLICDRATADDADLIVMTSHGRTGLSRAWLGSIADEVVRHSAVPVLLVRPIDSRERLREAHHLPKDVLVPLDGSEGSSRILPAAIGFAKAAGGKLTLLRIVPPVPLMTSDLTIPYAYVPSLRDDAATQRLVDEVKRELVALAEQLRRERRLEIDIEVRVADNVASGILECAHDRKAGLIAMSTRGRGMSRLLIGSVADKVLRSSGLPLLTVRPATAEELEERAPRIEAAMQS